MARSKKKVTPLSIYNDAVVATNAARKAFEGGVKEQEALYASFVAKRTERDALNSAYLQAQQREQEARRIFTACAL